MLRIALRILLVLITIVAATYLGDVATWQLRKRPTGSVTVHPYTAVPRNDKREELMFDDPYDQTCAMALFPHGSLPPCWYLKRYPEKRTDL